MEQDKKNNVEVKIVKVDETKNFWCGLRNGLIISFFFWLIVVIGIMNLRGG